MMNQHQREMESSPLEVRSIHEEDREAINLAIDQQNQFLLEIDDHRVSATSPLGQGATFLSMNVMRDIHQGEHIINGHTLVVMGRIPAIPSPEHQVEVHLVNDLCGSQSTFNASVGRVTVRLDVVAKIGGGNEAVERLTSQGPPIFIGAQAYALLATTPPGVETDDTIHVVLGYLCGNLSCRAHRSHGTQLKSCSQCRSIWYCGKDCQKTHWRVHKLVCQNLPY